VSRGGAQREIAPQDRVGRPPRTTPALQQDHVGAAQCRVGCEHRDGPIDLPGERDVERDDAQRTRRSRDGDGGRGCPAGVAWAARVRVVAPGPAGRGEHQQERGSMHRTHARGVRRGRAGHNRWPRHVARRPGGASGGRRR
jgi:hypothetical protein